jgi:hypothetical protein
MKRHVDSTFYFLFDSKIMTFLVSCATENSENETAN